VRRGSPSVLAVVETIAASGISLWLAWKHNSTEHIIIASALAPFLLLRTRLSTRYTLHVLELIAERVYERVSAPIGRNMILFFALPVVKVFCSIKTFLRHPLRSISHIATNFYENVFVIDLHIPPHVVSGIDLPEPYARWDVYSLVRSIIYAIISATKSFIKDIRRDNKISVRIFKFIFTILCFALTIPLIIIMSMAVVIPALAFRFSIKSTAFLWLPLLWIMYRSRPGMQTIDRIKLISEVPETKIMLIWSLFVIMGAFFKIPLLLRIWIFMQLDRLGPLGSLVTGLVEPIDVPLWQAGSVINAFLAWVYFFFRAKRHLLAKDSTEAWPEAWLKREYVSFQAVRTTLSLYAIACIFYIGASTAWRIEWPPIRFILFP
jgi:hypothetical protein